MKKLTCIVLLSALHSVLLAQWNPQISGTTENLSGVYFTDSLNGWVSGSNGIILHTDDGGINWEEQTSGITNKLTDVYFRDSLHGWAVGMSNSWPYYGDILRTNDGGNNWEKLGSLGVHKVYFLDTLDGYAVGAGGIFSTSDGGENWINQFYQIYDRGDVFFIDSLYGWVVASYMNGSTGYKDTYILNTINGGQTWNSQYDVHSRNAPYFFSVYFADSLKGWTAGGFPVMYEMILKTIDGGTNWDTVHYSAPGTLYSMDFADTFNGWAVGYNGTILYTSDAGFSWESIPSGTDNRLYGVYFTENGYGWAVGDEGTILHANYSQIVGLNEIGEACIQSIIQCFPNPFTTSTILEYNLTTPETVTITFYNQFGKLVDRIEQKQSAGKQQVVWTPDLPGGIYYFMLEAGEQVASGKVILVR